MLLTWMLVAPRAVKLCFAASHSTLSISQYNTLSATLENDHESTPYPPVRSAILISLCVSSTVLHRSYIDLANAALYAPVELLLHCSADSFKGKISSGLSYHSCTLPLSFLRLSIQLTARSISISGHLARSSINLAVSSLRCSCTNRAIKIFSR